MSAAKYDVIVVGAGHNGLVTAAYLAKAGRKVLVLERAEVPGGQLAARRLWPDVEAPALHRVGPACGRTSCATSTSSGTDCAPPRRATARTSRCCRTASRCG